MEIFNTYNKLSRINQTLEPLGYEIEKCERSTNRSRITWTVYVFKKAGQEILEVHTKSFTVMLANLLLENPELDIVEYYKNQPAFSTEYHGNNNY